MKRISAHIWLDHFALNHISTDWTQSSQRRFRYSLFLIFNFIYQKLDFSSEFSNFLLVSWLHLIPLLLPFLFYLLILMHPLSSWTLKILRNQLNLLFLIPDNLIFLSYLSDIVLFHLFCYFCNLLQLFR